MLCRIATVRIKDRECGQDTEYRPQINCKGKGNSMPASLQFDSCI